MDRETARRFEIIQSVPSPVLVSAIEPDVSLALAGSVSRSGAARDERRERVNISFIHPVAVMIYAFGIERAATRFFINCNTAKAAHRAFDQLKSYLVRMRVAFNIDDLDDSEARRSLAFRASEHNALIVALL
jgi:hypothetical protein